MPIKRDQALKDFIETALEYISSTDPGADLFDLIEQEYGAEMTPADDAFVLGHLKHRFNEPVRPAPFKSKGSRPPVPQEPLPAIPTPASIDSMKLPQLRAYAKSKGIKGYSNKSKAQLLALIKRHHTPLSEDTAIPKKKYTRAQLVAFAKDRGIAHSKLTKKQLEEKLGAGFFQDLGRTFTEVFNTTKDIVGKSAPIIASVASILGEDDIAETASFIGSTASQLPKIGKGKRSLRARTITHKGSGETEKQAFGEFMRELEKRSGHKYTAKQKEAIKRNIEEKHKQGGGVVGGSFWSTFTKYFKKSFNATKHVAAAVAPVVASVATVLAQPEIAVPATAIAAIANAVPDI
jgi:hypothetical protein